MDTILNPIIVPGWDFLLAAHPTKARVLQALTNLELAYFQGTAPARPTRKAILLETIRLGEANAHTPSLAVTSEQTVQRHLEDLAELGHVRKDEKGKSPWHSRYLVLEMSTPDQAVAGPDLGIEADEPPVVSKKKTTTPGSTRRGIRRKKKA